MILCINIGLGKKCILLSHGKKLETLCFVNLNIKYSEDTEWIYSFTTLDLRTLETSFLTPTNGNTSFICCFLFYYILTRLTVSVV